MLFNMACIEWNHVADVAIALILHTPFVVFYWRGTWSLQDYYFFPDNLMLSSWCSLVVGLIIVPIFYITQQFYQKYLTELSPFAFFVTSRLHTYVFAFGIVCHWRGVWILLDVYTEINWKNLNISTFSSMIALIILRSYRNMISVPLLIGLDFSKEEFFVTSTRFSYVTNSAKIIFDSLFTIVVVHSLMIVAWRGIWEMFDLCLFPDSLLYSSLCCVAIGYGGAALLIPAEYPLARLSKALRTHLILKVVVDNLFITLTSIVSITAWRGLWFLQNLYFFPNNPLLSYWITQTSGYLGLVILGSSSTALVRGCSIDNSEEIICNVRYFSHFFQDVTLTVEEPDEKKQTLLNGNTQEIPIEMAV